MHQAQGLQLSPAQWRCPPAGQSRDVAWQAGVMEARSCFLEGLNPNIVYDYRQGQGQREQAFLTKQRLLCPPCRLPASSQKGTASSHKLQDEANSYC